MQVFENTGETGCVVVLSGGADSATLLALAVERYPGKLVVAMVVDYGQRHAREIASARAVAAHYNVELVEVDARGLLAVLGGSSQTSADVPVPEGHYGDKES